MIQKEGISDSMLADNPSTFNPSKKPPHLHVPALWTLPFVAKPKPAQPEVITAMESLKYTQKFLENLGRDMKKYSILLNGLENTEIRISNLLKGFAQENKEQRIMRDSSLLLSSTFQDSSSRKSTLRKQIQLFKSYIDTMLDKVLVDLSQSIKKEQSCRVICFALEKKLDSLKLKQSKQDSSEQPSRQISPSSPIWEQLAEKLQPEWISNDMILECENELQWAYHRQKSAVQELRSKSELLSVKIHIDISKRNQDLIEAMQKYFSSPGRS